MKQCYVCKGNLKYLFHIPFDQNGSGMPIVDTSPIAHHQCQNCGMLIAVDIHGWGPEEITRRIYNGTYSTVDSGYSGSRADSWVKMITSFVPRHKVSSIRHLDYGGGEGHLSNGLQRLGWNSSTYDPYAAGSPPEHKCNFVTAVEVFEHSFNIIKTIADIKKFLAKPGIILFSTQVVPHNVDSSWWYLCPRGGHVGILTVKSLKIAAKLNGLIYKQIDDGSHCLYRKETDIQEVLGV